MELVARLMVRLIVEKLGPMKKGGGLFWGVLDKLDAVVETLESELLKMELLLEMTTESKGVLSWLDAIQKVDDLVDEYGFFTTRSGKASLWDGILQNFVIHSKVRELTAGIQLINADLQAYSEKSIAVVNLREGISTGSVEAKMGDIWPRYASAEEDSFFGMEDQKADLECLLLTTGAKFKVTSVCGAGGIGKTAIVRHLVERGGLIRSHFKKFAYVAVGKSFKMRKVWNNLAQQLLWEGKEEVMSLPDLDVAQKIYESLQLKKYLIVLDDVWSTDVWECLYVALPTAAEMGSRVLLTTRNRLVAEKIAAKEGLGYVHQMRPLTQEESLELLLKKAVQKGPQPLHPDLLEVASEIASKCKGLPLAISLIAGILAAKPTSDEHEWRMVMRGIHSYPLMEQTSQDKATLSASLSFAYDSLPFYLKPCFLYLGMFPDGAEIEVERLYLLWFAEGLIPTTGEENSMSMMEMADCFLYELWIRNMVFVQKEDAPAVRRFKSCRIHSVVRDLCLSKCTEENFHDAIYFRRVHTGLSNFSPFTGNKIQRLSLYFEDGCVVPVHWNTDKSHQKFSFLNNFGHELELIAPHLRSDDLRDLSSLRVLHLCGFNFEVLRLPGIKGNLFPRQLLNLRDSPLIVSDLSNLKKLRVLVFTGFNFHIMNLPTGIEKLFRLRYLSLRDCNITRLPSSIFSLLNLETLDLGDSQGSRVVIPNELQKLQRLRNLYLPHSYVVYKADKLELDALRQLETLVNFDSRPCRVTDLFQLTKLRKLAANVVWDFQDLEEILNCLNIRLKYLRFSSFVVRYSGCNLKEKLPLAYKLFGCPKLQNLKVEGPIRELPTTFSESFTEMHLSGSELQDDPIRNLEKLPHLTRLALRYRAFVGKSMTCSAFGMPQLKFLTLSDLPYLEYLTFEEGAFEKLDTLEIISCISLIELPEGLCSLTSLQHVTCARMPPSFMDRLHKAREDFHRFTHTPVS